MTEEELNILSKIKVRPVEEQRDYLLEQNMLLTGKIATLEKENAELKEKYVKNITDCDICDTYCNSQLTKAKELIKGIVDTPMYNQMGGEMYENEEYKELIAEAEQFLSEVEK